MDTIKDTLYNVEQYNSLIKYQLKSNNSVFAGERKINLPIDGVLPDFDNFKTTVIQILDNGDYSNDFIFTINRLYSLSEANSDLIVEGNSLSRDFVQKLRQQCSIFPHLDKLSLDVFQFIHYNILRAKDEFEQPITYPQIQVPNATNETVK